MLMFLAVAFSLVARPADTQLQRQYVSSQPVNLRLLYAQDMATVAVTPEDATCGMQGSQQICSLVDPRICQNCLASDPRISHLPELILDPSNSTYWQSSPWGDAYPSPFVVNVTVSLLNKMYILEGDVTVRFRTSAPEAMVLQKSRDGGVTWTAYQFFSIDCVADFSMEETNSVSVIADVLAPSCVKPSGSDAEPGVYMIKFDLTGKLNPLIENKESFYSELEKHGPLWEFLTLTDLRLVLMRPASSLSGGASNGAKLHYGIYSIDAALSCDCNLHGRYCELDNSTSQVHCNCTHNTEGVSCERCQAGYQALPWQPGSNLPFPVGTANECQVMAVLSGSCPHNNFTVNPKHPSVVNRTAPGCSSM
ncbi:netrin-G1-like [Patiria miniata]|uniref:Laminin N-terminal domain-containing protein n=1 Tax=Patiria miniata TaxID=46514 RepID=A0A914AS44_PATMI|nr:netrin-G1-like [Patiria miniata]